MSLSTTPTTVNDLVVFNTPQSVYMIDQAKRDQVRALSADEQQRWAHSSITHMRDLFVTAADSVEVANTNMAAFCIALNEVLSGEAWRILGYESAEDCIQAELSLEKIGKVRQARGEVANVLKNVGGFSNRIIASIMNVNRSTIDRDLLKSARGQLAHNAPVAQAATSGHGDQRTLGLDGKRRAEKRDEDTLMRDFLEFSYLYDIEDKSSRDIEAVTGTPYKSVQNTINKQYDDVFHNAVTQMFVKARRMMLNGSATPSIILELGITPHGLEYLLSEKGWLASDKHNHGESIVPVRSVIGCMLFAPSVQTWFATKDDNNRTSLLMDDAEHSKTTVSEIAQILHQNQSNVTYHLNKWHQGHVEDMHATAALDYVLSKKKNQTTTPDTGEESSQTSSTAVEITTDAQAIDAKDKGAGWTIISGMEYNNMPLVERMTSTWCDHIRVQPMNMSEMADDIQRQAFYLLDQDTTIDKKQSRRLADMVKGELKAFTNVDDCVTLISEVLDQVPQTQKDELLTAIDNRLASLNRLRDALTNPQPTVGLTSEEYKKTQDEYDDDNDIAELMQNSWF